MSYLSSSTIPIFICPANYLQAADMARQCFAHPLSDHLTLLNVFNTYMQVRCRILYRKSIGGNDIDIEAWSEEHIVNRKR